MLNVYDLSDGEGAEEEPMEVDEEMVPAVAANSAMMAHGQGPQVTGTTTLRSSLPGTSSMFWRWSECSGWINWYRWWFGEQ